MRRRDLFALPALAAWPRPRAGRPIDVRLMLTEPDPFAQLDRIWRFGTPVRVVARPHPAWWPSPVELPDRWQAWIETRNGARVRIVCNPRHLAAQPSAGGRVSALVGAALTATVAPASAA